MENETLYIFEITDETRIELLHQIFLDHQKEILRLDVQKVFLEEAIPKLEAKVVDPQFDPRNIAQAKTNLAMVEGSQEELREYQLIIAEKVQELRKKSNNQ